MKYKILIIDDEEMILSMMEKCLSDKFLVYTADSAKRALELLSATPDIILLDINMPEMDGLELCQLIRSHISCPIIFLTARVTEQDVIKGLSVGGDDYITKPFSMDELLARISAHLRREERKGTASNLRFDEELIINYNSRTVFYGETPLEFSNKEFEIIRLLSQNAGMVFDRETIYEKLWGYDGEGDSIVVKEHIRKIRNKLSAYTDMTMNEVQLDKGVLFRILENLLQNALRYAEKEVRINLSQDKDFFILTVEDDGKGFSEKDLEKATTVFYSSDKDGQHFGIGLSICHILCEKHGGLLDVSNNKKGACVTAKLNII